MEKVVTLLIPALFAAALLRLLMIPMRLIWKLGLHAACGFVCLWLLNSIAAFTGVVIPINAVTVLTAGLFGAPGMGVLAWFAMG